MSEVLQCLETNQPFIDECSFQIGIDSNIYNNSGVFSSFHNELRVFNDVYIEATLSANPNLPHIFYLGRDPVDYSKEEDELRRKRADLAKIKCISDHDKIAQNYASTIKNVPGINGYHKVTGSTYSDYVKTDFEKCVREIEQDIENGKIKSAADYTVTNLQELQTKLFNQNTVEQLKTDLKIQINWIHENFNLINGALAKSPEQISSERISNLAVEEQNWVKTGIKLHFKDSEHEKCLFCNSDLSNKQELIKHFSDDLIELDRKINELLKFVNEYYGKLQDKNNNYEAQINTLRDYFKQLSDLLHIKKNDLNTPLEPIHKLELSEEDIKSEADGSGNTARKIEQHYVAKVFDDYQNKKSTYDKCQADRKQLQGETENLDNTVKQLKEKAQNTREAAEKLNRLFQITFPYRKIEIANNDEGTGYVLKRNGNKLSFSKLSEGEQNFISLSYFLISLNDNSSGLANDGVVVIDDPVSSLDKNAIFQIFSLIVSQVEANKDRQYIFLTHNLDFFGHLREHYRKKIEAGKCNLYFVELTSQGSAIAEIPKLLKNYTSDYYYAYSILKQHRDNCSLEDSYLMVNLLRRWLETFLQFKFANSGKDAIRDLIERAYSETQKIDGDFSANAAELYRFINYGSHAFPDTETIDPSILSGASQRIDEAFKMTQILDPLHFSKLESVSNS